MLMLFPRFDKLSTTKNTNATFFSSRRKYNIDEFTMGQCQLTFLNLRWRMQFS
jgi:hypothetical protein